MDVIKILLWEINFKPILNESSKTFSQNPLSLLPNVNMFNCTMCGGLLSSENDLMSHNCTHISGNRLNCALCGNHYSSEDDIMSHQLYSCRWEQVQFHTVCQGIFDSGWPDMSPMSSYDHTSDQTIQQPLQCHKDICKVWSLGDSLPLLGVPT